MALIVASKNNKRIFNQEQITIGSDLSCDYVMSIGEKFLITLHYREEEKKCIIINNTGTKKFLHKNTSLGEKAAIINAVKFSIEGSDDFLIIKIDDRIIKDPQKEPKAPKPAQNFSDKDININQNKVEIEPVIQPEKLDPKEKLELEKRNIEKARTAIIKETGFAINDLKKRISVNNKGFGFVHIAMFVSSFISAFGLSNYLTGLKIEETANFIQLPTNIKIFFLFGIIVSALCLVLKQGVFLFYQNKTHSTKQNIHAQNSMIMLSSVFFVAIYIINLIYYININPVFAIFISLFFVALNIALSCAAGYFKYSSHAMAYVLDQYEYREDFEAVMNKYRNWIEKFINNISNTKISNIKNKLFDLQLKSAGEMILGIITSPFLAYGVSNTLAQCFPDAAGWIRISGLRFSPVFLILATFLIIFAFLAFTMAFTCIKKIQGSNVIKQDGFSNYLTHGVDILGIQAISKLEGDKTKALIIGCSIIFIEFTMNTSYFFTEIGGDLQGVLLSVIAALVPTALLIAETFMLSNTRYEIHASESLLLQLDRD